MIYRVLTQFNQNPDKNQDFKEHKLLTVRLLIIIKDQLIILTVLGGAYCFLFYSAMRLDIDLDLKA